MSVLEKIKELSKKYRLIVTKGVDMFFTTDKVLSMNNNCIVINKTDNTKLIITENNIKG